MVFTENLEEARLQREQSENIKQKEIERSNLEVEFKENINTSIISNNNQLENKDKETINSRLVTEYWKNKKNFNLFDSIGKVINDEAFSLNIWPQSPENWENFNDFKNRVSEFKKELIENIIWKKSDKQENKEQIIEEKEIPESVQPISTETIEKVWDILDNNNEIKTEWIQGTKDKIQSNLGLDNKQLNEKLNNKEKNISQAKELLFKKEQINEYSQNPKSTTTNIINLETSWEWLFKWEKIVDKDLTDILSNFIIETWKENLEEYWMNNPEAINEALNNAFELQIEKIKDWKVNYRTETVETLKKDILDDDKTNPLEKLEKFKELKSEIDTSVWSLSKKREKATIWEKKLKDKQEKLKNEYKKLNKNPGTNKERINEIKKEAKEIDKLLKQKKEEKSWIETIWLEFDLNSNSNEKAQENK